MKANCMVFSQMLRNLKIYPTNDDSDNCHAPD